MANYNTGLYVEEAINSIIRQTYDNWELIIVDDASTDGSKEIIKRIKDDRIILLENEKNVGLAASLNRGIKEAHNPDYLVRFDSDDISIRNRIEKQIEYMEYHKDVAVVGSNMSIFFEDGRPDVVTHFFEQSDWLMCNIPFSSPLPHPTWVIRVDAFKDGVAYNEDCGIAEDYDFMFRLFRAGGIIACINEPLVRYRVRSSSSSHDGKTVNPYTLAHQIKVAEWLGVKGGERIVRPINICKYGENHSFSNYIKCVRYCFLLLHANHKKKCFNNKAFLYALIRQIYGATRCVLLKEYGD